MIQIDNTIISLDVIEQTFVCDLSQCKGACCVEGDSGAPLEDNEIEQIEANLENILKFLPEKSVNIIREKGFYFIDNDGDKVTQLVNNKECVFAYFDNGIALCGIETAYKNKQSSIKKPISCYLYPIRLTKYSSFVAVNYHKWDICATAIEKGKKTNIHVYETCKNALIQHFGQEWYDKLIQAANYIKMSKKLNGR